ncbi:unnamed protein product [Pleuronectes platessa]|uniref:Uncharacterized protein n=1 Tax=Pleuronectes platessa TaxID=8262 RepID=A0A9N7U871_PLEPL|nr:unnamed protein product [Pleuronectes platessa]
MEYEGLMGIRRKRWGWVGRQLSRCRSPSWVCQGPALSQQPRSRAAAQAPAVLMITPNRPGTSSLWWLAEDGVEAVWWSLTVLDQLTLSKHPHPPHHPSPD